MPSARHSRLIAKALVAGIPSRGLVLGDKDAPIVIVEFMDLRCPHCAVASTSIILDLVERHVTTGGPRCRWRRSRGSA